MSTSRQAERLRVRVSVNGSGRADVDTGFPVLDRLLALLAEYAGFDIVGALAPGKSGAGAGRAARALGAPLSQHLRPRGARGHGTAGRSGRGRLAPGGVPVSRRPL